jgi:hypothetical protein
MGMFDKMMKKPFLGKKNISSLPAFLMQHKKKNNSSKIDQMYDGLKAYGHYEAYAFLVLMMALVIVGAVLMVGYLGKVNVKKTKGIVLSTSPMSANSSLATVQYADMSGTPRTVVVNLFPSGSVGEVVPLYVDASGNVYATVSAAPLNTFGILVIVLAVILAFFVLWRFYIILKFPGLAVVYGLKK